MRYVIACIVVASVSVAAAWWLGRQPVRVTVDLYPETPPAALEVVPDTGDQRLLLYHALTHPALPGSRLRVEIAARSSERRSFFIALEYRVNDDDDGRVRVERFHPGDGDVRTVVLDRVLPENLLPETAGLYIGIHNGTLPVPVFNVTAHLQSPPWPQLADATDTVDTELSLDEWRAEPRHLRTPAPLELITDLRLAWNEESVRLEPAGGADIHFYGCEVSALPYRVAQDGSYTAAPTHTYVALDVAGDTLTFSDETAWLRPSWGEGHVLASRFPFASVRWSGWSTEAPRVRFLKRPDAGITYLVNGPESGALDLYAGEGEEAVFVELAPARTARRFTAEVPRRALKALRVECDGAPPAVLGVAIDTWTPQLLYRGVALEASKWTLVSESVSFVDGRIPSGAVWEHGGIVTMALLFVVLGLVASAILYALRPGKEPASP